MSTWAVARRVRDVHLAADLTCSPCRSRPRSGGAAFRSLAALPDTENLGRTTDRDGRAGTELAFGDSGDRQRVIIDPDSGALVQFDYAGD